MRATETLEKETVGRMDGRTDMTDGRTDDGLLLYRFPLDAAA